MNATLPSFRKLSEIVSGAPDEIHADDRKALPHFMYRDTAYAQFIWHNGKKSEYPKLGEELSKSFDEKTVIDIGAGSSGCGFELAAGFDAKGYIGVEPCFQFYEYLASSVRFLMNMPRHQGCKVHLSNTDMRKFMSEMPANRHDVSMLVSGIDEWIMGTAVADADSKDAVRKYLADFRTETKRALAPGCRIVTFNSAIYPPKESFQCVYNDGKSRGVSVWEKL